MLEFCANYIVRILYIYILISAFTFLIVSFNFVIVPIISRNDKVGDESVKLIGRISIESSKYLRHSIKASISFFFVLLSVKIHFNNVRMDVCLG